MSDRNVQGTPAWLGAVNDRTALTLLLEHGALTRNRIGTLTGLSKPTAAQIVNRLEAADLIHAVGVASGSRGPSAAAYAVRTDRVQGVAIDIGETSIRSVLVDANGTDHTVVERTLPRAAGERSAIGEVQQAVAEACAASGGRPDAVRSIVIGVAGAIDPRTDELSFANTMPGWPRRGLRQHLEGGLGRQVAIDNDANLAAIAERNHGAGAGTAGFALLWMGSGLGVSVDLDGAQLHGAAGGAGEIGYLEVSRSAAEIDPAARDLQDLLGGPALSRVLRSTGIVGRTLDVQLARLASMPEREAALAAIAPRIALGILPVLAVLDPGLLVLGGPVGAAGGERLAELVQARLRRTTRWSPDIVASAVAELPVLRGARDRLLSDLRTALLDDVTTLST